MEISLHLYVSVILCISGCPDIIRGWEVEQGIFPYQASLVGIDGQTSCTGVIINETAVLTSATCILKLSTAPEDLTVVPGSNKFGDGTTYCVTNFYPLPKFDFAGSDEYDLGIIAVSPPFTYSDFVQSINSTNTGFQLYWIIEMIFQCVKIGVYIMLFIIVWNVLKFVSVIKQVFKAVSVLFGIIDKGIANMEAQRIQTQLANTGVNAGVQGASPSLGSFTEKNSDFAQS